MSWTSAILQCDETDEPKRRFYLTLRQNTGTWDAIDPKGVLAEDSGRLQVLAGIAQCYSKSNKVIVKATGLGGLELGASGVGSYSEGAAFTWKCDELL